MNKYLFYSIYPSFQLFTKSHNLAELLKTRSYYSSYEIIQFISIEHNA